MTGLRLRLPDIVRPIAGLFAIVVGGFALLRWTAPVAEWFAVAAVLIGAWALGPGAVASARRLGDKLPPRLLNWIRRGWPYAAVAAVVGWATWPVLLGDVPFTQDHAHHYLQTSVLTDDLIPRGHIFGWTERVAGGVPFGDVYGTGAYFVTGLLRIVSFGSVSLATSYSFGIFLVWAIGGLALVPWTRRLLDGVVARRLVIDIAAVAAAAFFVLDIGGDREGGWVYSMFHAVWPQILATGMWLWAILAMVRLLERPTTRRLGVAAIVTGFAFWAHPMNILNMLVTAPMLFTVAAFASRESDGLDELKEPDVWWLVPAFALAGVVGFGWVSHMLVASDHLLSFSAYGREMEGYAEQLLRSGALFDNGLAIVGITALFGAFVAVSRGGVLRLFTVVALLTFVVLSSVDLFASTDLGLHDDAPVVMFKRFLITAKPLLYALAGTGIAVAIAAALDARRKTASPLVTALILIVAAPVVWSTSRALPRLVRTPDSRILTVADTGIGESLSKMTELLIREQGSVPGPKLVMIHYDRGAQADYELFAVTQAGMGYLANRSPPAQAFDGLNVVSDMEIGTELGASHIITRGKKAFPGTVELGEFPPFRLLRIKEKPRDAVWAPQSTALVKTTAWEPMRHEVSVSNSKKGDTLIFGLRPYPKWRFTQNGEELEAEEYREGRVVLTRVSGFTDGTVVATYEDTVTEVVAFVLFLLVLFAALVGLVLNRRLPTLPAPIAARTAPLAAIAVTAILVGVVVWAQLKGAEGLEQRWAPGEDKRVVSVLHRTQPTWDYRPRPYCLRPFSRDPRADCDDSVLRPQLQLRRAEGTKTPTCLNVTIPEKGFIELTFDVPPGATSLRGRFEGPHRSVKKFLKAGGAERRFDESSFDVELDPVSGPVTGVTLRLENDAVRWKAVCLEIVAVGPS